MKSRRHSYQRWRGAGVNPSSPGKNAILKMGGSWFDDHPPPPAPWKGSSRSKPRSVWEWSWAPSSDEKDDGVGLMPAEKGGFSWFCFRQQKNWPRGGIGVAKRSTQISIHSEVDVAGQRRAIVPLPESWRSKRNPAGRGLMVSGRFGSKNCHLRILSLSCFSGRYPDEKSSWDAIQTLKGDWPSALTQRPRGPRLCRGSASEPIPDRFPNGRASTAPPGCKSWRARFGCQKAAKIQIRRGRWVGTRICGRVGKSANLVFSSQNSERAA